MSKNINRSFESLGTSISIIQNKVKIGKSKNYLNNYSYIGPIIFSPDKAYYCAHQIRKMFNEDIEEWPRYSFKDEYELASNLKRFALSLYAYYKSKCPRLTRDYILSLIIKKEAASILKKIRKKSLLLTLQGTLYEVDEELDNIPGFFITDIGDIFNYKYWIFWFEEDPKDFLLGLVSPLKDETILNEFETICKDTLAICDDLEKISESEVLYIFRGSKTFTSKQKLNHWEAKSTSQGSRFSQKRKPCVRTVVRISPEGTRDSVINQIDDLNSINLLEYQLKKLLEQNFEKHILDKNPEIFDLKYKKFQTKYNTFYCRDFEKEGITKSHEVIRIIGRCLCARYPEISIFKYIEELANYSVKDPETGITHKMLRGHGLGMGNALTTLLQIFVTFLFQKRSDLLEVDHMGFFVENDDMIWGFQEKDIDLDTLFFEDYNICSGLGLKPKASKSFLSPVGGVFCEEYFHKGNKFLNEKESYTRRNLVLSYSACNIVQAKYMVSSVANSFAYPDELRKIMVYWGYEFFDKEFEYPTIFGGWTSSKLFDQRLDLMDLKDDLDAECFAAYFASKHQRPKLKIREEHRAFTPFIFLLHSELLNEEFYDFINIFKTTTEMKKNKNRIKTSHENYKDLWEDLYQRRHDIYLKSRHSFINPRDVFKEIVSEGIYLVPERFTSERLEIKAYLSDFPPDFRTPTNQIQSVINFFRKEENLLNKEVSLFPLLKGARTPNNILSSNQYQVIQWEFGVANYYHQDDKDVQLEIPLCENWERFAKQYINPVNAALAYNTLQIPYLPLYPKEWENKEHEKYKLSEFKRYESFNELLFFYQNKCDRRRIKYFLNNLKKDSNDLSLCNSLFNYIQFKPDIEKVDKEVDEEIPDKGNETRPIIMIYPEETERYFWRVYNNDEVSKFWSEHQIYLDMAQCVGQFRLYQIVKTMGGGGKDTLQRAKDSFRANVNKFVKSEICRQIIFDIAQRNEVVEEETEPEEVGDWFLT